MIKKLRTFMAEKNISQSEMARRIGTTKFTFSRWMNKRNVPSAAYKQIIKGVLKNQK